MPPYLHGHCVVIANHMPPPEELPPTLISTPQPSPISVPGYLQENELPKECRDLVLSLPTERGWVANYLHQYQGFWHTTRQLQAVLACQQNFQAQDYDVFLVTTPKSGTTWLKAIMFALVNWVRFPDRTQHPLLKDNPHVLVPFFEYEYIGSDSPDTRNFPSPRLLSTHLPSESLPRSLEDMGCKIVYLCSDPKDTLVSLRHFTNKLRLKGVGENPLKEAFEKFCKGVSLCGPVWDHVLGYWKMSVDCPQKVWSLMCEEIKKEPKVYLKRLSEFLGCPFSREEQINGVADDILKLCSFDNLRNLEVNKTSKLSSGEENKAFFRRHEVGDSVNYLTREMMEQMDQITGEKLCSSGLKF